MLEKKKKELRLMSTLLIRYDQLHQTILKFSSMMSFHLLEENMKSHLKDGRKLIFCSVQFFWAHYAIFPSHL